MPRGRTAGRVASSGPATGMEFMIGFERNRERERFYLLPGMGGRAARQKQWWMLQWAVVGGLVVSTAVAAVLYFAHCTLR
jgi:hypothetical protein